MNEYTSEIMTMEEMIDTLKGLVFNSFDRTTVKERQALDMAIKALGTEQTDGDSIPRQAVITMLNKIENAVEDGDGFQFNEWIEYAKDIPSAEKTAEWIKQDYGIGYRCTNCGKIVMADDSNELNFCCNCGAKMKGVE